MLKHLKFFMIIASSSLCSLEPAQQSMFSGADYYNEYLLASYEEFSSWSKIAAYRLASYLTDPVCKAREYGIRLQILDDLPTSKCVKDTVEKICAHVKQMQLIDESWLEPVKVSQFAERCFLMGGSGVFSALSVATTIPGMILRSAACNLETEKFIYLPGLLEEKQLAQNTFTHMQWNICGVKGGYDIEKGAQMPIWDDLLPFSESRMAKIAEKILQEDADVLCLNEVFDINDALVLVKALQTRYAHFVIHCGARTVGLSSGLFFATKFGIKDVEFTPFPKHFPVGVGVYTEKGVLSVKTYDAEGPIATMLLSHLQHSDEPEYPTDEEIAARANEIDFIMQKIDFSAEEDVVLAGDLNLTDEEFSQQSPDYYTRFKKTVDYSSLLGEESKTWLGDQWYVQYGNKDSTFSLFSAHNYKRKISSAMNLDHVLAKASKDEERVEIQTVLKHSGYDPSMISRDSLSDHLMLLSTISIQRSAMPAESLDNSSEIIEIELEIPSTSENSASEEIEGESLLQIEEEDLATISTSEETEEESFLQVEEEDLATISTSEEIEEESFLQVEEEEPATISNLEEIEEESFLQVEEEEPATISNLEEIEEESFLQVEEEKPATISNLEEIEEESFLQVEEEKPATISNLEEIEEESFLQVEEEEPATISNSEETKEESFLQVEEEEPAIVSTPEETKEESLRDLLKKSKQSVRLRKK